MKYDITTVSGLAKTALVTDQGIRIAIRRGTLAASKVGGSWVIDRESAERWLETRLPTTGSERQQEASQLGVSDETIKARRRRRAKNDPGDDSLQRAKATEDLAIKRLKRRQEEINVGLAEAKLYEAEPVEKAFKRLAGFSCSLIRAYAATLPGVFEKHLPTSITPSERAACKANLAAEVLRMIERDIEALDSVSLVSE